jgi:Ca2+-binding EF-hand superfamily protein
MAADLLRGSCPPDRVARVLAAARLRVEQEEIDAIVAGFRAEGDREKIDYRKLPRAIDEVRMDRPEAEREADPTFEQNKREKDCRAALAATNQKLDSRRITPWLHFKGAGEPVIAEDEFREKIAALKLEIPDEIIDALVEKYSGTGGIEWESLCADIDQTVFL